MRYYYYVVYTFNGGWGAIDITRVEPVTSAEHVVEMRDAIERAQHLRTNSIIIVNFILLRSE